MATLISRGEDIGFTILPYSLDRPIHEELIAHPSDHVLGYITHNRRLANVNSFTRSQDH